MQYKKLIKILGPGLLYAGAAVGVSRLDRNCFPYSFYSGIFGLEICLLIVTIPQTSGLILGS